MRGIACAVMFVGLVLSQLDSDEWKDEEMKRFAGRLTLGWLVLTLFVILFGI